MPFLTKNLQLGKPLRLSSWRKIAMGTWWTAGDPSAYALVEMDVEPALRYLAKIHAKTGHKITLTHFVGKAIANSIAQHPKINCVLRLGRLYPRKTVDVFFQIASDTQGEDLSGSTIRESDRKHLMEIAEELRGRAKRVREQGDPDFKKMKGSMKLVPGWLSKRVLDFAGFIMYTLNLWTPLLGSPKDPFGSVMVTSIGPLGLDAAWAPLVPYSRVPLLLAVGTAREKPIVRNGEIVIGRIMPIGVTLDHRVIDGVYAAHLARTLHKIFADPEKELGPV